MSVLHLIPDVMLAGLIITIFRGNALLLNTYKQNSSLLSLDYSKGFSDKYGVDKDKVDKNAVGFECQGKTDRT